MDPESITIFIECYKLGGGNGSSYEIRMKGRFSLVLQRDFFTQKFSGIS